MPTGRGFLSGSSEGLSLGVSDTAPPMGAKKMPFLAAILISPAEARRMKDEMRANLARGIDPSLERKMARAGGDAFNVIAGQWLGSKTDWSESHRSAVISGWSVGYFRRLGGSRSKTSLRNSSWSFVFARLRSGDKGNFEEPSGTYGRCSRMRLLRGGPIATRLLSWAGS